VNNNSSSHFVLHLLVHAFVVIKYTAKNTYKNVDEISQDSFKELDKIKKFGATWEWKSTRLGNGRYSATCEFYRGTGFPSVTGKENG